MLSPEDIRNRTFPVVRRGFDPDEVRDFLQHVAVVLQEQQEPLTGLGEGIQHVLEAAQTAADRIRDDARADAAVARS